jgi:hypothetical protein
LALGLAFELSIGPKRTGGVRPPKRPGDAYFLLQFLFAQASMWVIAAFNLGEENFDSDCASEAIWLAVGVDPGLIPAFLSSVA